MTSGANFILIFCIWIIGIIVAVNYFMPQIMPAINGLNAYSQVSQDNQLKQQIGMSPDDSFVSLTPLGVFEYLK